MDGSGEGTGLGVEARVRADVVRALITQDYFFGALGRAARRGEPTDVLTDALDAGSADLVATLAPSLGPVATGRLREAWLSDIDYLAAAAVSTEPLGVIATPEFDERCANVAAAAGFASPEAVALGDALCAHRREVLGAVAALDGAPSDAVDRLVTAARNSRAVADVFATPTSPAGELLFDLTALLTEHGALMVLRAELQRVTAPLGAVDEAVTVSTSDLQGALVLAVGQREDFVDRWAALADGYRALTGGDDGRLVEARRQFSSYLGRVLAGHTPPEITDGVWSHGDLLTTAVTAAREGAPVAPLLLQTAIDELAGSAAFLAGAVTSQFPEEF
ncbi:hypothetical protein BH24ACT3_BH24ACT3_05210 [soil metagenome]